MKKGKKALSILLALLLVGSACSAMFGAFAAGGTAQSTVADLEERMVNFKANLHVSSVTQEQIDEAEALAKEFKDLSEIEKDAISPDAFGNLYNKFYMYENKRITDLSGVEKAQAIVDLVGKRFGEQQAREDAIALQQLWDTPIPYKAADGTEKTFKFSTPSPNLTQTDKLIALWQEAPELDAALKKFQEAYAGASETARAYFNITQMKMPDVLGFSSYNGSSDRFAMLVQFMGFSAAAKAEPFHEPQPDASDKDAMNVWNAKKSNWLNDLNGKALKDALAFAPELRETVEVVIGLKEAYQIFIETDNLTPVTEAMARYSQLDRYHQIIAGSKGWGVPIYSYTYPSSKGSLLLNNLKTSQLYAKCEETGGMALVAKLEELVLSKDLSKITNDDVRELWDVMNTIPRALKGKISAETLEKYNQIVALYIPAPPLTPSEQKPDLSGFQPTQVPYPADVTPERADQAAAALNAFLLNAVNGIEQVKQAGGLENLLKTGVYTNASVGIVLRELYGLLDTIQGIPLDLLKISPANVAGRLEEAKFAQAAAAMTNAADADSVAGWANVAFADGAWGFSDGDRDGFVQAVVAGLRPIVTLVDSAPMIGAVLKLPNTTADNGDYVYGAYEDLIPILEGLGLRGVISSEEYSRRYNEAQSKGEKLDTLLLPILMPVFDLLDQFVKAPADVLLDTLPRLARLVEEGTLHTQVHAVLGKLADMVKGALGDLSSLNLTGEGLQQMLSGLLADLNIGGLTLKFTLPEIAWDQMAGCGALCVADSVAAPALYRADLIADRGDTFILTLHYVAQLLAANQDEIAGLLAGIEGMEGLAQIVGPLLGDEAALTALVMNILAPADVPQPEPQPEPSPEPEPADPTQEPDPSGNTPETGDTAAAIAVTVAVLSGAAFVLARKKRSSLK